MPCAVPPTRWAYALRTELGDGRGQEDIRAAIHRLVEGMTSEQLARERSVIDTTALLVRQV